MNTRRRQHRQLSLSRAIGFRVLAVALGLLPFVFAEAGLRLAGWRVPASGDDPYVAFSETHPLFIQSGGGRRYETNPVHLELFSSEAFPIVKADHEYRIFCLGGSTVQGRPYSIESSFSTWLELSLRAADDSRQWEVVNCGGASYASYRLVPILEEVLTYQPDLVILYTGHNEFLEARTYETQRQSAFARCQRQLAQLRLVQLSRRWAANLGPRDQPDDSSKTQLAAKVEALLDYRGGLEHYKRDDAWRRGVVEHYRDSLARMLALCRDAGVPVLRVNPACNLKDSYPFKVTGSEDLSSADQARFDKLWQQGREAADAEPQQAAHLLAQAISVDDRHAGAHYVLGQSLLRLGRLDEAKQEFIRAKDEDICPLRMTEPLHEALRQVAQAGDIDLVDIRALFEAQTDDGIPGDNLFVDHVHPTIHGHQMIAARLFDRMQQMKIVRPGKSWKTRRDQAYQDHLATLDAAYYLRGRQRLEGLRLWAQGRAKKDPSASGER